MYTVIDSFATDVVDVLASDGHNSPSANNSIHYLYGHKDIHFTEIPTFDAQKRSF